ALVAQGLEGKNVLDAAGCIVGPGLVDLHTHLRQPGREEAETVESGSRAAALGGYTAIIAMPNTEPTIDNAAVVREVLALGATALCDVHVAGAITVGRAGDRLAPMAEMADLGVRLFTDDGAGVQDGRLMRRAFEYACGLAVTLAQHCEDDCLAAGGQMHEGEWSSRLGIAGMPAEAEQVMILRDLALARLTGGRIHFMHVSTAGSVEILRAARRLPTDAGEIAWVNFTCEAAPHHFTLTDADVAGYDPLYKVNPPLRSPGDVAAIKAAIKDFTIDAIATDHAPHAAEAKEAPFDEAPPGMIGLETALALAITELDLTEQQIFDRMSARPATIAGLTGQQGVWVEKGAPANLCVVDPAAQWIVDPAAGASKSRNTPFAGRKLTGKVRHTILGGEPVVLDGVAQR
nr:dihydroorotase [Actinomycetota bacterium]